MLIYNFVISLLTGIGFSDLAGYETYVSAVARAISIVSGVIVFIVARFLIRAVSGKTLRKINERVKNIWIEAAIESKLFKSLSNMTFPVVMYLFTYDIPEQEIWDKVIEISLVAVVVLIFNSCMKIVSKVYGSYEVSKTFPIHGVLQAARVAVLIIGGIAAVSSFVDQSPVMLLGSIGALTAVTSIVFRDAILGFAAGIHLTATGMIKIGDRVELPRHSTDGIIIGLSLMTVTIENLDKTIISVPAYTLISEEFINWRGIIDTGARRIKRSIFIDVTGIRICGGVMTEKFRQTKLLKDYFDEIDGQEGAGAERAARLTNIGVFRAYITAYLKQHADIRQDLVLVVRHLEASGGGIPLEIYAFANATVMAEYEAIQSDIFDHLYAVIPEFGLELYQSPSSSDIRQMKL